MTLFDEICSTRMAAYKSVQSNTCVSEIQQGYISIICVEKNIVRGYNYGKDYECCQFLVRGLWLVDV